MDQKPSDVSPVILIVEDDALLARAMKRLLTREISATVLTAETVSQAKTLFEEHPEIMFVIMDANVPVTNDPADAARLDKRLMTTEGLTRSIRAARRDLIMIAASSDPKSREELVKAGCDHNVAKEDVIRFVIGMIRSR